MHPRPPPSGSGGGSTKKRVGSHKQQASSASGGLFVPPPPPSAAFINSQPTPSAAASSSTYASPSSVRRDARDSVAAAAAASSPAAAAAHAGYGGASSASSSSALANSSRFFVAMGPPLAPVTVPSLAPYHASIAAAGAHRQPQGFSHTARPAMLHDALATQQQGAGSQSSRRQFSADYPASSASAAAAAAAASSSTPWLHPQPAQSDSSADFLSHSASTRSGLGLGLGFGGSGFEEKQTISSSPSSSRFFASPRQAGLLSHSGSVASIGMQSTLGLGGGLNSPAYASGLAALQSYLTNPRVFVLSEDLQCEAVRSASTDGARSSSAVVDAIVLACNSGGHIGTNGIINVAAPSFATAAASADPTAAATAAASTGALVVKPTDILRLCHSFQDSDRSFSSIRSLARAVRLAHFMPADTRRPLYDALQRHPFVKAVVQAQALAEKQQLQQQQQQRADAPEQKHNAPAARKLGAPSSSPRRGGGAGAGTGLAADVKVTASDIDQLLDSSNVGTHILGLIKELDAAGRGGFYTSLGQLSTALKTAYTVPLSQRKHALDFMHAQAAKLFTPAALTQPAATAGSSKAVSIPDLCMHDIHLLFESTGVGFGSCMKYLSEFVQSRRKFDSFEALQLTLGRLANMSAQEKTEGRATTGAVYARSEIKKVAAYLAGNPRLGIVCPLFRQPGPNAAAASAAAPFAVSMPMLHRLFALAGGIHALRRTFEFLESSGQSFRSFPDMIQGVVDATARAQEECRNIQELVRKEKTRLFHTTPASSSAPGVGVDAKSKASKKSGDDSSSAAVVDLSFTEVQRLYQDGYAAEDTLMHLRTFLSLGQSFPNVGALIQALRVAHKAEMKRRKVLQLPVGGAGASGGVDGAAGEGDASPVLHASSSTTTIVAQPAPAPSSSSSSSMPSDPHQSAQDAILSFLSAPDCLLFANTEQDLQITANDIAQLIATAASAGDEEAAPTDATSAVTAPNTHPAVFYLSQLNSRLQSGDDDEIVVPPTGFQSFHSLLVHVQSLHMLVRHQVQAVLQLLCAPNSPLLSPEMKRSAEITEAGAMKLVIDSEAGLHTLRCLQTMEANFLPPAASAAAGSKSGPRALSAVERTINSHVPYRSLAALIADVAQLHLHASSSAAAASGANSKQNDVVADVHRELATYLHNPVNGPLLHRKEAAWSRGLHPSVADLQLVGQECPLFVRRISEAEHAFRTAENGDEHSHAAFVPSSLSMDEIHQLYALCCAPPSSSASSPVGSSALTRDFMSPRLLIYLLSLCAASKSYVDVSTLAEDVRLLASKEAAAMEALWSVLADPSMSFWRAVRERTREERAAVVASMAGFPFAAVEEESDPDSSFEADHAHALSLIHVTPLDLFALLRAAGGVRRSFQILSGLHVQARSFDNMAALIEEVERVAGGGGGGVGAKLGDGLDDAEASAAQFPPVSAQAPSAFQHFAAMSASELAMLQRACMSQGGDADSDSKAEAATVAPVHTLRLLSFLQRQKRGFASRDQLLLALQSAHEALSEREFEARIRQFQRREQGADAQADAADAAADLRDTDDAPGLLPARALSPKLRHDILTFLASGDNLLFSECASSLSLSEGDIAAIASAGGQGASVVELLRHLSLGLHSRFNSVGGLVQALELQYIAAVQGVTAFLVQDARLTPTGRFDPRAATYVLDNLARASKAEDAAVDAPEFDLLAARGGRGGSGGADLLSLVQRELFGVGGCGAHTLPLLQEIVLLPEPSPHAGLPLTVSPPSAHAEVTPHRTWRALALALRRSFDRSVWAASSPSSARRAHEQKQRLADFFRNPDHAPLFAPAAGMQIHDADLSMLLRSARGSASNLLVQLQQLLFARKSFKDVRELIAAVQQDQKAQIGMQRSAWLYINHPLCKLMPKADRDAQQDRSPTASPTQAVTFGEMHEVLVRSECGGLTFTYLRALDELGYQYRSLTELTSALSTLHARSVSERSRMAQRLFEHLNSAGCTLFAKEGGGDIQLRKSELDELIDAEAGAAGAEVDGVAAQHSMELVERLIKSRLEPLDADPQEPRFASMAALIARVRGIRAEEDAQKARLATFLRDKKQAGKIFASTNTQQLLTAPAVGSPSSALVDMLWDAARVPNDHVSVALGSGAEETHKLSALTTDQVLSYLATLNEAPPAPRISSAEQLVDALLGLHARTELAAVAAAKKRALDRAALLRFLVDECRVFADTDEEIAVTERHLDMLLDAASSSNGVATERAAPGAGKGKSNASASSSALGVTSGLELESALLHLRHMDMAHVRCSNMDELAAALRAHEVKALENKRAMHRFLAAAPPAASPSGRKGPAPSADASGAGAGSVLLAPGQSSALTLQHMHELFVHSGAGDLSRGFLGDMLRQEQARAAQPGAAPTAGHTLWQLNSMLNAALNAFLAQAHHERGAILAFLAAHSLFSQDVAVDDRAVDKLRAAAPMPALIRALQALHADPAGKRFADCAALQAAVEEAIRTDLAGRLEREKAEAEAKERARIAEVARLAAEAEAARLRQIAEAAEAARQAELKKQREAEEAAAKERARIAEEARLAAAAEAARLRKEAAAAEAARQAELRARREAEAAEAARLAEQKRLAQEEADRVAKRAAEEEAARKAAEREAARLAKEAADAAARAAAIEAQRLRDEEAARQAAEAEAARVKKAAEDAAALAAALEAQRLADEEAARVAAENARIAAEAEAARQAALAAAAAAAEAERLRLEELERQRQAELAAAAAAEAERLRLEEIERQRLAEEARLAEERRIAAEEAAAREAARLKQEEDDRLAAAAAAEAERLRLQREEEARLAALEAARVAAEQAEKNRLAAAAAVAARMAAELAERNRLAAEQAEKRRLAEEAEKARLAEIARLEALRLAEEEARRRAAAEAEQARLAAELAEKQRLAAEDEERRRAAEAAEQARLAEEARLAAEEAERRRLAEEAEQARLAAEAAEKKRLAAEEDERRRAAEAAEIARREEEARLAAIEAARLAAEIAEKERLAAEAARVAAENARIAAEAEAARQAALAAVAAAAEAERLRLEELERQRQAELAAAAAAEAERLRLEEIEHQRLAEEARLAEERRLAAEAAEKARLEEEARLAAIEAAEQKRLAAEAETARLAAEAAEQARLAAEEAERLRLAEEAEKARLAELARLEALRLAEEEAERVRLAEEARLEELRQAEEAARLKAEEEARVARELAARLAALKSSAADREALIAFVASHPPLVPAQVALTEFDADDLLQAYAVRGGPADLHVALGHMHEQGSSHASAAELLAALQKLMSEETAALRAHLRADGSKLWTDGTNLDALDLSDAKLNTLLAAAHTLPSALDHCARLMADSKTFPDADALTTAIREQQLVDEADRGIVRTFINDESELGLRATDADAAALLALREGRSTKQLVGELKVCDQEKNTLFAHVDELISALQSQRVADALAAHAAARNELKAWLEASALFNGIKVKMIESDLEALLNVGGTVGATIGYCEELDEIKKRFFSLQDLLAGLKKLLALEAEKQEALGYLRDTSLCVLWSEVQPLGRLQSALTKNDIERMYEAAKIGLGTLGVVQGLNDAPTKFGNFHELVEALRTIGENRAKKQPPALAAGNGASSSAAPGDGEDDTIDEEDEIGALPVSPRPLDSPAGPSRTDTTTSTASADSDSEPDEDDVPIKQAPSPQGHGRTSSFSSMSPTSSVRHALPRRQNSSKWMQDDVALQLIESADPSTFEEYASMRIRCKNLAHVGKIGMSNVFIQFSRERGHIWERCGGTEPVKDDLSPTFETLILSLQKMCHSDLRRRVKIEALESAMGDTQKPAVIGSFITTPGEMLARAQQDAATAAKGGDKAAAAAGLFAWELLEEGKKKPKVRGLLYFEEIVLMVNTTKGVLNTDKAFLFSNDPAPAAASSSSAVAPSTSSTSCKVRIQMVAKNVEKMDLFGKSDPYCIFYLADSHGKDKTFVETMRTEVIEHTLNPQWVCFVKSVKDFADNDYDRRIRVKMFDWDNVGTHDYIGQWDMTLRSLLHPKAKFRVINDEKLAASKLPGGEKYKHSGTVTFKIAQHFSMIGDIDREADASLVRHKRAYTEATNAPVGDTNKRKAYLAFMAGGQALVKAQALVRMATGLALHKTAEELTEETNRLRLAQASAQKSEEGLKRMATNMALHKSARAAEETLQIAMRAEGLPKMDTFGLCDGFVEFFRLKPAAIAAANQAAAAASSSSSSSSASPASLPAVDSSDWESFAKSEVQKTTLNPKWAPLLVRTAAFFGEGAQGIALAAAALQATGTGGGRESMDLSTLLGSGGVGSPISTAATRSSATFTGAAVESPPVGPHNPRVLLKVSDWNSSGEVDFIGAAYTDYLAIRRAKDLKLDLLLVDPAEAAKGKPPRKRGLLIFEQIRAVQVRTEAKDISATSASAKTMSASDKKKKHGRQSSRSVLNM